MNSGHDSIETMTTFKLEQWLAPDKRIPHSEWNRFREQYLRDRGLNPKQWMGAPQHEVFRGQLSWLRLLPNDTVTRIQSTGDLSLVLPDIIQETINNIENSGVESDLSFQYTKRDEDRNLSEGERTNRIEAAICNHIVGTLKGDVEGEKLNSPDNELPPGEFECPSGRMSIPISIINSGQYVDYAIYTFDSGEEVFGSAYGNSMRMTKRIIERDAEPATVIRNVAFQVLLPNITWGAADPPDHPIAFYSVNGHEYSFEGIQNPQQEFQDSWGDVEKMNPNSVSNHIYTASPVYWDITLGMCY